MSQTFLSAAHFWTWGQAGPHVNTRIPQDDHHPHLNNLGRCAHGLSKSTICAVCVGTTWWRTTAGTIGGGPADDTGSAETGATTGGRSGGGTGAVDWLYISKLVRGMRSMIVLDGSHKIFFLLTLCGRRQPSGRPNWRFDKIEYFGVKRVIVKNCRCATYYCTSHRRER